MWYHSPESNDWTDSSYIKIMTLETIEEFWSFYDLLKEFYISTGMFFLMKKELYQHGKILRILRVDVGVLRLVVKILTIPG